MLNRIALLDKAQISLDSLQNQDCQKVIKAIEYLKEFPFHPSLKVHKLKLKEDYYLARAGRKYRVIFHRQGDDITITDIVNHDRLERLYGSLSNKEVMIETA